MLIVQPASAQADFNVLVLQVPKTCTDALNIARDRGQSCNISLFSRVLLVGLLAPFRR